MVKPVAFGATHDLQALDEGIGDGGPIAAKARIVEHLHRTQGFDVLAFEANFYGLKRAWREIHDEGIGRNLVRLNNERFPEENFSVSWQFGGATTL